MSAIDRWGVGPVRVLPRDLTKTMQADGLAKRRRNAESISGRVGTFQERVPENPNRGIGG